MWVSTKENPGVLYPNLCPDKNRSSGYFYLGRLIISHLPIIEDSRVVFVLIYVRELFAEFT